MRAALILFILLTALEWLFWLSPARTRINQLMKRLGDWYMLVPYHYLLRLVLLGGVLLWDRPELWPLFAAGWNWLWSFGLGLVLVGLTYRQLVQMSGVSLHAFVRHASAYHRSGAGSWLHAAYVLAYPAFVEELIWRWFFVAALWPVIGWWTVLVGPLLNLIWHLPVWVSQFGPSAEGRKTLLIVAFHATLFAMLLTVVAGLTQNLAGAILAHAFGDWAGTVLRYRVKERAAG